MIYNFPTNRSIEAVFKGDLGSRLESYMATKLPPGKVGRLVELAIEIQSGINSSPFINTKVPIGKRSKYIEICFIKKDLFFICTLASNSRSPGQLLELAEIVKYVQENRPKNIRVVPLYVLTNSKEIINVVDHSEIFGSLKLHTVQRSSLCDTSRTWQN